MCCSAKKQLHLPTTGKKIGFKKLGQLCHYLLMELNLKALNHTVKKKVPTEKQPQRTPMNHKHHFCYLSTKCVNTDSNGKTCCAFKIKLYCFGSLKFYCGRHQNLVFRKLTSSTLRAAHCNTFTCLHDDTMYLASASL